LRSPAPPPLDEPFAHLSTHLLYNNYYIKNMKASRLICKPHTRMCEARFSYYAPSLTTYIYIVYICEGYSAPPEANPPLRPPSTYLDVPLYIRIDTSKYKWRGGNIYTYYPLTLRVRGRSMWVCLDIYIYPKLGTPRKTKEKIDRNIAARLICISGRSHPLFFFVFAC